MIHRSFYFVRHGETDWNKIEKAQGWTDIPLNDTGRQQARAVAPHLSSLNIDRLVVSPLSRARETAEILNEHLQKPLLFDERLKERNFGILEGMIYADIQAWRLENLNNPEAVIEEETGYPLAPQAETYKAFLQRTSEAINHHLQSYKGERLLFVAHGGIYRVLCRSFFNDGAAQSPNVKPYHFEKMADGWQRHEV